MSTLLRLGRISRAHLVALCLVAPVAGASAADEANISSTPAQPTAAPVEVTPPGETASAVNATPVEAPPAGELAGQGADSTSEEMLAQASFSMQLQKAPLMQMLTLLSASSPVRFRYAAPPDAVVTTTLHDAPLLSTLENLLHSVGYTTHRQGMQIFICRWDNEARLAKSTTALPVAWQVWTRRVPPPPRWMAPSPLPNRPRAGTKDQWQMEKNMATAAVGVAWRPAALSFEARQRPGVAVEVNPVSSPASSDAKTGEMVYLRWNLALNHVPRGAQLLLETPHEATLYVNGAPLLRKFRHVRLVDLGEVLQPGDNCLAIALRRTQEGRSVDEKAGAERNQSNRAVAPQGGAMDTPEADSKERSNSAAGVAKSSGVTVKTPVLRYEWFFGGDVP